MEQSCAIIRLHNSKKLKEFLELMIAESKLFFKNYDFKINILTNENEHKKDLVKFPKWLVSVMDINTEFLKNKPDQFTFVFVFQAFRTGAVLDKTHISLLFDSPSKKDDTILQSFLDWVFRRIELKKILFLWFWTLKIQILLSLVCFWIDQKYPV